MPLISDEKLNEKLNHPANCASEVSSSPSSDPSPVEVSSTPEGKIIPLYRGGRKPDVPNLSPAMRTIIGAAATIEGNKSAAETFDVTTQTAQNLKNGKVNGLYKDTEHASSVAKMTEAVNSKALDILCYSLGLIGNSEKELEALPIRGKAAFAKDIATISQSMRKNDVTQVNAGQIIMMAPPMADMEELKQRAQVINISSSKAVN